MPGGRIKNRIFSSMDLLQPRIITEKEVQYRPDEIVHEAKEEDNQTLLSEYHGNDNQQLSGYDGSGSVQKNPSSDHVNLAYLNSQQHVKQINKNMLSDLMAEPSQHMQMRRENRTTSASGVGELNGVNPGLSLFMPTAAPLRTNSDSQNIDGIQGRRIFSSEQVSPTDANIGSGSVFGF